MLVCGTRKHPLIDCALLRRTDSLSAHWQLPWPIVLAADKPSDLRHTCTVTVTRMRIAYGLLLLATGGHALRSALMTVIEQAIQDFGGASLDSQALSDHIALTLDLTQESWCTSPHQRSLQLEVGSQYDPEAPRETEPHDDTVHAQHETEGGHLFNLLMVAITILCAALAAGLTMGLVSIEPLEVGAASFTRAIAVCSLFTPGNGGCT